MRLQTQPGVSAKVNSLDELAVIKDRALVRHQAYVDGAWVGAASKKVFEVVDPATLDVIGSVPDMDVGDVRQAVGAAMRAFET
ncbi:Succinate-semialdehyde dehydrogenase, mitochondrial, partial [Coemansia sp. RSA 2320]